MRELERPLGRKTVEVEILEDALAKSQAKNQPCSARLRSRTVPGEDRGRHPRRCQIQPDRAAARHQQAAVGPPTKRWSPSRLISGTSAASCARPTATAA